jgi:hypothetical protein
MRRCTLCTAVHDPVQQRFIVSHGNPISELAFNSRCCHYARQRGRDGCINPCRVVDQRETLEGRMAGLEATIATLHPEVRECLVSSTPAKP